jgi:site-specific recombinase XerD
VENRVQKHKFRHHTGYQIATYFDAESGAEFFGPRQFLEYLSETKGSGQATLNAVINDLQRFLSYLCACSDLQVQSVINLSGTGLFLNRVLLMYPSFLAEGRRSPSQFVSAVAHYLGFEGLSRSSTGRYLSTVNSFLKFNDEEWISQQALNELFEVDTFVSEESLIEQLGKMKSLKKTEKAALLRNSMLAGCISGGPKKITRPHLSMPDRFGRPQDPDFRFYEKRFPIEKILDLIKNASSYRDICLFSLMAGTGIRTSEAMQMRFEDILIEEELVQILPYAERIQVYDDITDRQITELAFKGRTTKDVLFLNPFKEIFFENLLNYITEERDRFNPSHDFVFVTIGDLQPSCPNSCT